MGAEPLHQRLVGVLDLLVEVKDPAGQPAPPAGRWSPLRAKALAAAGPQTVSLPGMLVGQDLSRRR